MRQLTYTILLFISFIPFAGKCQQTFTEGVITYKVTIDPPANQEGLVQYTGTYTITVKGQQVKEELQLDNGYKTSLLYDYGKNVAYSLKSMYDRNLAIQLDMQELKEKNKKYEGFAVKEIKTTKRIAEEDAKQAIVTYSNGNSSDICYSGNWLAGEIRYDHFPGINLLLLSFTYNDDGLVTSFKATSVVSKPVAASEFKIPANYKIITNSEYRQLKK